MLAFLPGFPLFLKFMKRPITALKRCITLSLLPRNRLTFHSIQNPPLLPQQRILRHRTHPWVLSSPRMSHWLPPRNQHPLGLCWIASLTFPHHYAMPTTSAHPLCSRVACRTRFAALLLPHSNFPRFKITSTNTLPLTYALTSALASNLALTL